MHTTLQARSSPADWAPGTPPTPTRPATAANPIPLRSRWVPRLRLAEHPLALTLLVVLAALAVAQLLTPAPAQAAIPIVGGVTGLVGGVANDIFIKGFGALLQFIFGNTLTQLAQSFLTDLLDVTPLSGPKAPAGLGELHSAIDGAGWGLLTLSFTGAALGYWLSSYTSSGAQQAATAFARTVGAIGLLISSPYIFYAATEAVNQLTHAIITTPLVGGGTTQLFKATFVGTLLTQGGVGMIAALIAAVMALALILVKITITALLAVLYVLSPLAIGLWPVEQLSWLLRTLLQVAFIALIFPVLWAVCFAVFAVLTPDFTGGLLKPLFGVAALIVAFKLPFALLRISTGAGLMPSAGKGMSAVYHARGLVGAR
jgi:hypothetical protein